MKIVTALLTTLLLVPVALATETPRPTPPVLALAPADALGIVYLAKPPEIFEHPLWTAAEVTGNPVLAEILRSTAATFRGPTMIAVSGSPVMPATIRIELATQPPDGAEAFFLHLRDEWIPAFGKVVMGAAGSVEPDGALRAIRLPGPLPLSVFAAEKNGLIYGSSRLSDVSAWLEGKDLPPRFVAGDDVKKLSADALASADVFAHLNTRVLMPLAGMELDRVVAPGLTAVLGFDRLEFAALTAEWSRQNVAAEVTLGLTGEPGAAVELLAPRNSPLAIASLVPTDYSFFLRGALTNAADVAERVITVFQVIDPAIVAEFRQECAEFRAEYGFDPLQEFAGNLVDEWIIAGRINANCQVVFVGAVRLADPALFQTQAAALIRGFNLTVEKAPCGADFVYSAPAASGVPIAWATVGNYLVVSSRPDPIVELAAAQADHPNGTLDSPALRDVMRHLPAETARLAFVNLAPFAKAALTEVTADPNAADVVPAMETLSRSEAGVGLALTRGSGALTIRAVASEAVGREVRQVLWQSFAASTARAHEMAMRVVSASNMKGILMSCIIHANEHKGAWPATIAELVKDGSIPVQVYVAPYDTPGEAITAQNVDRIPSSYLYRVGTGLAATDVVLSERELRDDGANFGFADGHTEWVAGQRARELLAVMKSAAR